MCKGIGGLMVPFPRPRFLGSALPVHLGFCLQTSLSASVPWVGAPFCLYACLSACLDFGCDPKSVFRGVYFRAFHSDCFLPAAHALWSAGFGCVLSRRSPNHRQGDACIGIQGIRVSLSNFSILSPTDQGFYLNRTGQTFGT